jgi:hypothetical protein
MHEGILHVLELLIVARFGVEKHACDVRQIDEIEEDLKMNSDRYRISVSDRSMW